MSGDRLKVDLSDNFENRFDRLNQAANVQNEQLAKLLQLERLGSLSSPVQLQSKELLIYQKRLGLSPEDALNAMREAQHDLDKGLRVKFDYLESSHADQFFSLYRAIASRNADLEKVSESAKSQSALFRKGMQDLTRQNLGLRNELARKTK